MSGRARELLAARRGDERGLAIVIVSLMVTGIALIVALVVDLGQVRTDRRMNKSVTDLAARAGISRLPFGPWAGVCRARGYLLENASFTVFDPGSETWSNAAAPPNVYPSNPCPANPLQPDTTPCAPDNPATWAKLQATAGGGRFTVEIQSGYYLPDPRFPEDAGRGDTGDPAQGGCDNLSVVVTQLRPTTFGQVAGAGSITSVIRSVGRLNAIETIEFVAALQLLERNACNVLQTGGSNTRVISQAFGEYPGTIQIDSAADSGSCPSPILNSQSTSGGPSVVACSTNSANPACSGGTGVHKSRIGIYALNFNRPPGNITNGFPATYGDTVAIASPRTGRKFADRRYRQNVVDLDAEVQSVLTGNGGLPPGCTSVVDNWCTGNGVTWLVLSQSNCNSFATFFLIPGRSTAQHIWFNCDITVNSALTLSAPNSYIVINGALTVSGAFTISDPRKVYVWGRPSGNRVGIDVGGSTSIFTVNNGLSPTCSLRTGPGNANRLVLANGQLKVGSGATLRLCQTFVYLASGFGKVPATDGTVPCKTSACTSYTGTVSISSGGFVDWSAPNEITGRLPTASELATTNRYEDLALWTEAGGNSNGMAGGATTSMAGSFFMPNADSFNLTGGGALPVYLSAQFIATSLKVSGGATINLVPNPEDSIPTAIYNTLLVR